MEVEPIVAEAKAVEPKAAAGWAVVEAAKGAAAAAAAAVDELEDTTGMARDHVVAVAAAEDSACHCEAQARSLQLSSG